MSAFDAAGNLAPIVIDAPADALGALQFGVRTLQFFDLPSGSKALEFGGTFAAVNGDVSAGFASVPLP